MAANTNQGGVREVTTTIEKCGLEEGREFQWQIRNFDTIRSSCLAVIRQNFGPLNGKVTLKLDLTRLQNESYELGIQVEPLKDVMWMNVQFKMHGEEVTEFAISGDLRSAAGNRLAYALEVPALNTLKFTFVPEILLSVSNVVGGSQSENQQSQQNSVPPFNTEWVNQLPPFLQHIVNQRIAEGQHWVNFFRDYPTDFTQMQQSLMSALNSSELVRETPRMLQSLYDELRNNPDYAQISQRLQDLLAGTQPQPENVQPQAQQNQQQNTQSPTTEQPTTEQPNNAPRQNAQPPNNEQPAFGPFPPVTYNMCEFIERGFKNAARRRAEQRQARFAAFNANSAPTENVLNREDEFTQIYNTMADTYKNLMNAVNGIPLNQQAEVISQPTPQQNVQPTAPPSDVPMETVTQQPVQQPVQQHIQEPVQQPIQESVQQEPVQQPIQEPVQQPVQQPIQEPVQQEPVQQGIYPLIDLTADEPIQSTSNDNRSRSESATNWTFLFTAKGITGYIYHVKNLGSRVPYHRNFCSSETWKMPDGQELKVELVHALHPDAPFICLIDVNEASDMAFVQTLIDGNGQELHKIDSFSDSYHGFTVDQLLQSASVDDVVRIKIEAIPNMD